MNDSELTSHLAHPDFLQNILGSYHGNYSLGVTQINDGRRRRFAYHLWVEDEGSQHLNFKESIQVNGERIPIIVERGFESPRALR
jgi:hypothetical protein